MVEAEKHGAVGRACIFRASVLWYVVFFSMAVDDRGLNLAAYWAAPGPGGAYQGLGRLGGDQK